MKVGIVGQRGNERAVSVAGDVADRLLDEGVDVVVDEASRDALLRRADEPGDRSMDHQIPDGIPVDALSSCHLAVSVGGDGTFLYTARGAGTTPIMGVNLGEVGFLNAVSPADAVDSVSEVVERLRTTGNTRTRSLPRLSASAEEWTLPPALNDIVVQGPQRGRGRGVDVTVRVDGSLYTEGHADGVLVATATGSTAYNLSEKGPIVHPDAGGFVVNDMCGEDAMPPLVVDTDVTVTIGVEGADRAIAVSDGRVTQSVTPPGEVVVSRAEKPVRVAGPPLDFFPALEKLS
jgi:NAD+ kinase